jgi:hypothetical protein
VGHELSRLGWGAGDDEAGLLAPPEPAQSSLVERRLRTALSCALDGSPWRDLPDLWAPPTADQAALGKVAWFGIASAAGRASVTMLHGYGGTRPRVEPVTLLGPVPNPAGFAVYVSTQVEGAAALRYATPESTGETRLRNVEVAWNNLFEGRVARVRVPDAGPYRPGDYERGEGASQRARPNLVSITAGGLYVRVHGGEGADQPTLFLDGKSIQQIPGLEWPKSVLEKGHAEMTHVDGTHVPVALFGSGAAIVRARRAGSQWDLSAFATGFERPADFGLVQHRDIAYAAGRAGFHVLTYDAEAKRARGFVFPFRAAGPVVDTPIPVPSQRDAADPPKACPADEATKTPRVVVPFQAGTRHPVVVVDASEPLRLLVTSGAVMYGTPDAACMAALDAEVVKTEIGAEPQAERAILPLGDLEHSWLFRVLRGGDGQQNSLQYRMMSCRFEPRTEVPAEAYRLPGTTVGRGF